MEATPTLASRRAPYSVRPINPSSTRLTICHAPPHNHSPQVSVRSHIARTSSKNRTKGLVKDACETDLLHEYRRRVSAFRTPVEEKQVADGCVRAVLAATRTPSKIGRITVTRHRRTRTARRSRGRPATPLQLDRGVAPSHTRHSASPPRRRPQEQQISADQPAGYPARPRRRVFPYRRFSAPRRRPRPP